MKPSKIKETRNQIREAEIDSDYKVDLKQTLYANLMWLWMTGIMIGFIIVGFTKVNDFKDETIHMIYLIVMLFVTVKLLNWTGGPIIRLKRNEVKK